MTDINRDWPITIKGEEYKLSGSLKSLRDVQNLLKREVTDVRDNHDNLTFEEVARLFAVGIKNAGGTPPHIEDIEAAVVHEIQIEYARSEIGMWLAVATSVDSTVEKKREILLTMRTELKKEDSHGENIDESDSES